MADISLFSRHISPDRLLFGEAMLGHTTFGIGGPALLMVLAQSAADISTSLQLANNAGVPAMVMGKGSNILVRDGGLEAVVVKLSNSFGGIHLEGDALTAQAGVSLAHLSQFAMENSLAGLEFACGIPGSLGGGVYMNAGAYDGQLADVIESVEVITPELKYANILGQDMGFGYRQSRIQKSGEIVVGARLRLTQGNKDDIAANIARFTQLRNEKQPLEYPSAGSVFKRPKGHFTGKLISDARLKGYTIGGAQVSDKHAGFIINIGNATAQNVEDLIEHIRERVYAESGVVLEAEIKIIGSALR